MKIKTRISAIAAIVSAHMLATPQIVFAQEQAQADDDVELIMVTGSFVRRSENFESPSPLAVVDSVAIDAIGAKNIGDITQTLTINTGHRITRMHLPKTRLRVRRTLTSGDWGYRLPWFFSITNARW